MRFLIFALTTLVSYAHADGEVLYLGNEGLLVSDGNAKILFDPLFRNHYGQYQLVPAELEKDMMAGVAPFDGVDAVFVSHFHGDHFAPQEMTNYLRAQQSVRLYAPRQAVDELMFFVDDDEATLRSRVVSIDIEYGDAALQLEFEGLLIEAFHIPHSGWPDRRPEVHNIAFRVTLNDDITVLHMGDADTRDEHFAQDGDRWADRPIDAAFPPYWYFASERGKVVLDTRLQPAMAIGVHVPVRLPEDQVEMFKGYDLFQRPGETRDIESNLQD